MISLNEIYEFLKKLLGHPIFKFTYPFVISILMLLVIADGKALSYLILSTKNFNSENMSRVNDKLFEDKIAIFNDGDVLIDNTDFVNTNHVTISKNGAEINKVKVWKTNREDLKINIFIDSIKSSVFHLRLIYNEVFEKDDVVILSVIYSKGKSNEWNVKSRVKGIPQGVTKSKIKRNEGRVIYWVNIILIGIIIIMLFRLILFKIYKKKFVLRNVELYPVLTFFGIAGVLYYEYFQDRKILEQLLF
ncbi:MAG: hypothetical protein HRT58_00355 [Crocinitomicaceae bacterium]|nr:hypothetical protein [Flavobacteriales bacterium]NQZ34072.1 hypothetical protein [Crocinitomicaceae bacterium]